MENQKNKKIKIIIIAGAIIALLLVFISLSQDNIYSPAAVYKPLQAEISGQTITVAACPTFYYLLEKLKNNNINIVETNSTAESLYFLQKNKTDLIIAGRKLKPEEPQFLSEIIGSGYSFISDKELLIQEKEMGNYNFFTDLSPDEIIDKFSYIIPGKISEVENVYNYLSRGIIITSVENTDYSKSKIVHIYKKDSSRHRFSRTPIIYFSNSLNKDIIENIKAQIRNEF